MLVELDLPGGQGLPGLAGRFGDPGSTWCPECRYVKGSIDGHFEVGRRPVALPLRSSVRLWFERVATGVWVEHHRGPTRRQYAGECRAPGRTVEVVPRSA
jgi:hypothetical protein